MFVYPKTGYISLIQTDNAKNVTITKHGEDSLIIFIDGRYFIARASEDFISVMDVEELEKLKELQKQRIAAEQRKVEEAS